MEMNLWDTRFLDLAKLVSTWSKDPSTQAGAAIISRNKSVISVGFNGFPALMPDKPEWYENREEKYSRIIHAEMNALLFANKSLLRDCTLYTYPFMPCDRCVVHMIQAGIQLFVAPEATPEQLRRWGHSFKLTTQYITECGGELVIV